MAAPAPDPAPENGSFDSRQKSLVELSLIAFGFTALPLLQGIANAFQSHPLPATDPASPLGLLGYAWNLVLLGYLMASSPVRLPLGRLLWRWDMATLARGLVLAAVLLGLGSLLGQFLPKPSAQAMPFSPSHDPLALAAILASLILAVSLEELLYRVYYLERLTSLGARPPVAVALSVCLFSLGHQYQGLIGVVSALVLGTLLSLAWLRWRRYWLNWTGHLAYNLAVLAGSFWLVKP